MQILRKIPSVVLGGEAPNERPRRADNRSETGTKKRRRRGFAETPETRNEFVFYLNAESNFCSEEEKSSARVNFAASAAPNSRFMPQSSHSTESGPS